MWCVVDDEVAARSGSAAGRRSLHFCDRSHTHAPHLRGSVAKGVDLGESVERVSLRTTSRRLFILRSWHSKLAFLLRLPAVSQHAEESAFVSGQSSPDRPFPFLSRASLCRPVSVNFSISSLRQRARQRRNDPTLVGAEYNNVDAKQIHFHPPERYRTYPKILQFFQIDVIRWIM